MKLKSLIRIVCAAMLCAAQAAQAEPPLYETGPAQDSSFVRFLNATDEALVVTNGTAKISLTAQNDSRTSRFFPVTAGRKLTANVSIGTNRKLAVEVTAKPSEFITIALVVADGGPKPLIVRESPSDFNGVRASLSLTNLDQKCAAAAMTGGAKNSAIVENVKAGTVARRLVNPVALSVQANCDGQAAGQAIDLGQLQGGERYSVFLINSKGARKTFFVRDTNS